MTETAKCCICVLSWSWCRIFQPQSVLWDACTCFQNNACAVLGPARYRSLWGRSDQTYLAVLRKIHSCRCGPRPRQVHPHLCSLSFGSAGDLWCLSPPQLATFPLLGLFAVVQPFETWLQRQASQLGSFWVYWLRAVVLLVRTAAVNRLHEFFLLPKVQNYARFPQQRHLYSRRSGVETMTFRTSFRPPWYLRGKKTYANRWPCQWLQAAYEPAWGTETSALE